MGHVQTASHYYCALVRGADTLFERKKTQAVEECLRSLNRLCRVAVPFPRMVAPGQGFENSVESLYSTETLDATTPFDRLLNLVHGSPDVEDLIWSPLMAHRRQLSVPKIVQLQKELQDWSENNHYILAGFNSHSALENPAQCEWNQLPFPPPAHSSTRGLPCLTAAHYNFYMARTMWALCLAGKDTRKNERAAYLYFYEAMRLAATQTNDKVEPRNMHDSYIPREAIKAGYLPLLHTMGQCCPGLSWLRWIIILCEKLEQEGPLKGRAFAVNLECLRTFEVHNTASLPEAMRQFPEPSKRVVCQLIPEPDGCHYTSFFVRPRSQQGHPVYQTLGHARWRGSSDWQLCSPDIKFYNDEMLPIEKLSEEWLLNQKVSIDWLARSPSVGFDLDLALRDHINGSRLLPPSTDSDHLNTKEI